jgi:hypothetical protein
MLVFEAELPVLESFALLVDLQPSCDCPDRPSLCLVGAKCPETLGSEGGGIGPI